MLHEAPRCEGVWENGCVVPCIFEMARFGNVISHICQGLQCVGDLSV